MRRIIEVTGEDRVAFLQGLVSNDVRRAPCWAALLTPQGKYLADFLVIPKDEALLIDVDAAFAEDLLKRLSLYKLRSKVDLRLTDMTVARGTGDAPEGAVMDPRHPALGWRLYGAQGDDGTDWAAVRVEHLIPESGIELIPNETFILEAGFERLHGVDFRKGCYVGQEVTARMKHKTELRRGLVQVTLDPVPVGTRIETADGREAGTVYTQSGGRGIAMMRLDRVGEGLRAAGQAVRVS